MAELGLDYRKRVGNFDSEIALQASESCGIFTLIRSSFSIQRNRRKAMAL
jgi:hypothetical protein